MSTNEWLEELKGRERYVGMAAVSVVSDTDGLGEVCNFKNVEGYKITVAEFDRLIAIVEGAEQAEDGEGNLFCPICGGSWSHWSHDRSKPAKYGDKVHLTTCPYSDEYKPDGP